MGENGNDTLVGGAGSDYLDGGLGNDTVDYSSSTASEKVYLELTGQINGEASGGDGDDTLYNIENIIGSAYSDLIYGSSIANSLDGGKGDDTIYGGDGNDTISVIVTGKQIGRAHV